MTATDTDCELCEAARLSAWFHEDAECWVAECESCAVPMVVWKSHAVDPPADAEHRMLEHLNAVAEASFGAFWIDPDRRSIPDHWHVHARPRGGFMGHSHTLRGPDPR